jgi:CheY-like chemotaxis protein
MKISHRIAIVDDDADDREVIRDAFAASGQDRDYIVLENGDKLLQYLEDNAPRVLPSLILLDLNMPGKDGRETLRLIKSDSRFRHIPVIVFTTSSSQRDMEMSYDLGANCFISKPDTFNKLIEMTNCISKLWLS